MKLTLSRELSVWSGIWSESQTSHSMLPSEQSTSMMRVTLVWQTCRTFSVNLGLTWWREKSSLPSEGLTLMVMLKCTSMSFLTSLRARSTKKLLCCQQRICLTDRKVSQDHRPKRMTTEAMTWPPILSKVQPSKR